MERLLSSTEAAELMGIKEQTLRIWRCTGGGPPYVKLGGPHSHVHYRPEDVAAFIKESTYTSTSDESVRRAAQRGRP